MGAIDLIAKRLCCPDGDCDCVSFHDATRGVGGKPCSSRYFIPQAERLVAERGLETAFREIVGTDL